MFIHYGLVILRICTTAGKGVVHIKRKTIEMTTFMLRICSAATVLLTRVHVSVRSAPFPTLYENIYMNTNLSKTNNFSPIMTTLKMTNNHDWSIVFDKSVVV